MDPVKVVANHFEINDGFNITMHSDVPPGSGLGGSSTMIVAIISAITNWIGKDMSKHDMAHLSYRLEREELGWDGGKQDQYAAVFGGFNYLEMDRAGVNVRPANLCKEVIDELQFRSVLCFTKITRKSAGIIRSQKEAFKKGYNEEALDASKMLARRVGRALEEGNIDEAAAGLDESWTYKKQFSDKISNRHIDKLYDIAKSNGAIGGKVSGAGGGGFMYFICKHDKKPKVSEALKKAGAELTEFTFDPNGVTSWRSRDGS
jgi:D-glycero-alpha-D-manno-heptose-7-phosphate kinase